MTPDILNAQIETCKKAVDSALNRWMELRDKHGNMDPADEPDEVYDAYMDYSDMKYRLDDLKFKLSRFQK